MKKVSFIFALMILFTTIFSGFAQAQERKKWSPQAKGAVIGGLGGAAAGALIHKRNRAVGGVVGGVAGAGVGYAIGKRTDNRRKAEAARVAAARRAAVQREAAFRAGAAREKALATNSSSAPAKALSADDVYNLNTSMVYTPAASGVVYLPNNANSASAAAYPSSEVRRKSW